VWFLYLHLLITSSVELHCVYECFSNCKTLPLGIMIPGEGIPPIRFGNLVKVVYGCLSHDDKIALWGKKLLLLVEGSGPKEFLVNDEGVPQLEPDGHHVMIPKGTIKIIVAEKGGSAPTLGLYITWEGDQKTPKAPKKK